MSLQVLVLNQPGTGRPAPVPVAPGTSAPAPAPAAEVPGITPKSRETVRKMLREEHLGGLGVASSCHGSHAHGSHGRNPGPPTCRTFPK